MAETEAQEEVAYKVPEKVSMKKMMDADNDDESLRKWKESILGNSKAGEGKASAHIKSITVNVTEPEVKQFSFPLETDADTKALKDKPVAFRLKEGCIYTMEFKFSIENDIVMGLKYENAVSKKGIRLTKQVEMLGSYGPQAEDHTFTTRVTTAPSGMLARGKYQAKSKFIDDDGQLFLAYEYHFEIKKEF